MSKGVDNIINPHYNTPSTQREHTMNKRIVIIVSGGIADWVSDKDVDVMLIDTDNLDQGDTLDQDDIDDFNDLIPEWIKDQYIS